MLEPSEVQDILKTHDAYWASKRDEMRELRRLYLTEFWERGTIDNVLHTEVPRAYAVTESYMGSLYAKNPAVKVEPDLRARGNPEVAEATANQYLTSVRNQLEDASRLALIYPCSFIKLAPENNVDPLKRVSCAALPPWEVILDATACSWDQQRYIGHVYLMPLAEAMSRFGKSEDVFSTRSYSKWIEDNKTAGGQSFNTLAGDGAGASSSEQWIRVAELYDIEDDKLLVWSEDYNGGLDYLFTGVKVQVGALPPNPEQEDAEDELENQHETTGIPYKSASGRPVVPILPLYFSRDPDTPLRGYSLIHRSRDQFREMNLMRTYQAQGVRRLARQWLVRAGFLSEDGAAKISQGLDGEFIEIDLPPGTPLEGNMMPVDNPPIPADVGLYASTVENDIREAGLLAPFTRGETTNTTATEQQLLASYTSTELGRMARVRDELITSIAYTYNVMLSVVLGDDAEPLSLPNPVGPTVLSADDLTGDFRYWAVDAGGTPMSDLMKQQTLERMAPTLVQLGVPAALVLEEIVRTFQLPESFVIAAREAAAAQETGPSPEGAPAPLPPEEGEL